MPLALLNGSSPGQRSTGIGVITLALAKALCLSGWCFWIL